MMKIRLKSINFETVFLELNMPVDDAEVRRRYGSMNGLQEVFHEMDADHSGEIDYDEFLTICDEVKFPGNPVTLFKYLDADGSKTLSFDELDARVMEALIWEERPAAPLSCPLHVLRTVFMTRGAWLVVSANFERLVLDCIEAGCCK